MRLLANGELSVDFETDCPMTRAVLDRVGDKWSARILALLGRGTQRFNGIKRGLDGISQRVLTSTLRALERDGFVERRVTPTKPPQVAYTLTKLGRGLLGPIGALAAWAESNQAELVKARRPGTRAG